MKSATYASFGPVADVLKIVTAALPKLQDDEVRMLVLAAPVNPSDLFQVEGMYPVRNPLPAIGGMEGVGQVAEIGSKVTNLALGDTGILPAGCGSWATEIVVKAANVVRADCKNYKQLAMLTINPPTAYFLLQEKELVAGDWVIQTAANSTVGNYVILFAKSRGIKTVNIVRNEKSAKEVRDKGGDVVLIESDDLVNQIAAATNKAHIKLLIDSVGGPLASRLIGALGQGGLVVNYGAFSGQPIAASPIDLIFKGIRVKGFWVNDWLSSASQDVKKTIFDGFVKRIDSGEMTVSIDSTFSLDKIQDAIIRANASGRNGKVLVLPNGEC